ncbi:MAG: MBL fold metallo-hydrolase [Patescibacteria group bacterium]
MRIKRLIVGQLQTNCYLLIDGREALVVVPGDHSDYIRRLISHEEVKLTKIVATHGHYDHILAVTELKLGFKIPFLMHKEDKFLLNRMSASASRFSGVRASLAPKVDNYIKEGDSLSINHQSLTIIHTPGHTPGSISLYSKADNAVLVGDLIFEGGGVGRTDFAYSNREDLKASINKILKLPNNTKVYSGHGEESILDDIIIGVRSHLISEKEYD